jgi:hypothetical protein
VSAARYPCWLRRARSRSWWLPWGGCRDRRQQDRPPPGLLAELLEEHRAAGALPTSARFLFYELVARGVLSKARAGARRPDQMLHDALTDLRGDGRVPWAWIADETRALEDWAGSPTVAAGLASAPSGNVRP